MGDQVIRIRKMLELQKINGKVDLVSPRPRKDGGRHGADQKTREVTNLRKETKSLEVKRSVEVVKQVKEVTYLKELKSRGGHEMVRKEKLEVTYLKKESVEVVKKHNLYLKYDQPKIRNVQVVKKDRAGGGGGGGGGGGRDKKDRRG